MDDVLEYQCKDFGSKPVKWWQIYIKAWHDNFVGCKTLPLASSSVVQTGQMAVLESQKLGRIHNERREGKKNDVKKFKLE
ncbi:hypothetical protein CEXT_713761 [Caerostris extrusa]|uniref:Uncharacterized protein n=1 Tax=Caerostris extrusa TaxID=172846 RepID=A0AAV4UB16_CAEEX|nr:hypothetical protein CEXT_713761 [Caerostris extrusa]